MKTRSSILMAISLLILTASVAFVSAADSSAAPLNQTENQAATTVDETEATGVPGDASASNASENASTTEESSSPDAPVSVQGIWKVSLAGMDITMALNQSGESIFGRAKFEGEQPWNGAVAGSLSGNSVHLSLAALQGDVLSSVYLGGAFEDDSLTGSYVRSDSSGKAARGDLTATLISPDTSGYTPAAVAEAAETVPETASTESSPPAVNITESAAQSAATTQSKFKDVTQLAKGINPNILPRMAAL